MYFFKGISGKRIIYDLMHSEFCAEKERLYKNNHNFDIILRLKLSII